MSRHDKLVKFAPSVHNILATPPQQQPKEPSMQDRSALVTLFSQGQFESAAAAAALMTTRFPQHAFGWKVLGAVLKKLGRTEEALVPMQKAAQLAPMDYEAFNNLGVTLKDLGRADHALACYRRAIELKHDYPEAHGNLGDLLREHGKLEEALVAYRRRLQLEPGHGETRHLVASLAGENLERPPEQYVEAVFDVYADTFDAHLQQALQYDVPAKLAALLKSHAAPSAAQWRVLDLGCGTGLMGEAVAPWACQLVGVDVSGRMLEKAAARKRYQRLEQKDLLEMLQSEPAQAYDLILSADVFIYVGKIDEVVAEVARLLPPGGLFAFSVEDDPREASGASGEPGYWLQQSGRYGHAASYLDRLAQAHGFSVLAMEPTQIRLDANKPVKGRLALWRR